MGFEPESSGVFRTVVVADDEEDIRLLCRINLEAEGFVVHEAADADELMRIVREVRPLHTVLLDVTMPERDGFECLAALKADPVGRDLPVIMLSARVEEAFRQHALALGAADYIEKPFRPGALLSAVRRVMSG